MSYNPMLINKGDETVINFIKKDITEDSIVNYYILTCSLFAFNELKEELKKSKQTNINITNDKWNKLELLSQEYETEYRNKLNQRRIALEIKELLKNNINILMAKNQNLMLNNVITVKNKDDVAMFNPVTKFTLSDLGIVPTEIQYTISYQKPEIKSAQFFLDMLENNNKNNMKSIKEEFIKILDELIESKSPEYIYFITLYNIFTEELLESKENQLKIETGIKETKVWNKLYQFQEDGAMGIISKIEKYGGCILADSVGLGKTFTALSVIKYYELRNDRVLVLAPKKLRENWTIYTQNDIRNPFQEDRFNYDVLNHTDLSRYEGTSGDINLETLQWQNYDLLVIDESHNFRNNNTKKDTVTRYQRLMEDVIKSGTRTKVLMLSATPVNTKMNDLKNQISFITEDNDTALRKTGIKSIEQTLRIAQLKFNSWSSLPDEERTTYRFLSDINNDYFKLLDALTIARSRKHIEKYYGLTEIGEFPTRLHPKNIYSNIDIKKEYPELGEINTTIKNLNFAIYSPLKYLLPSKKQEYADKYDTLVKDGKSIFKQADREDNIIGLMRVNMLKRMESSIHSFGITVANILKKIDEVQEQINSRRKTIDETEITEELDDEDLDSISSGKKIKIYLKDMDLLKWNSDLNDDKEKLEEILKATAQITEDRDDKLLKLKEIIEEKINNPINNENKKILMFTAFADTADYLYDHISEELKIKYNLNTALVKGSGQNKTTMKNVKAKDINTVLTHFSPKSKERQGKYQEEIDILIATDCISEGQNLQDCDYLINYDIHWNPVRIIQRFGRIDRIGSENKVIQLVNFWPNMELDEYINLENRVKDRMVMLDTAATGDGDVLDLEKDKKQLTEEEKKELNELKYRQKQLERLKSEVVDLEDVSGGISITDLTLNDFKMDLQKQLEKYSEENFTGLYAIAKIPDEFLDEYKRGVIFNLKQIDEENKAKNYNTFHPYYLTYIGEDSEIIYSYTHTKNILDILKKLGKDNIEVNIKFENRLKKETKNYKDMSKYRRLLEKSIENIIGEKEDDGIESLFSPGGTNIGIEEKTINSFEVISYLILE